MASRVTTLWFLDTDSPQQAVTGAKSDPGFARRLLSRLYPTATITSLGAFPLNRSAPPGPGEIYIGSFTGVTVVQSSEPDATRPSALEERWRLLVPAPVTLVFSYDPESRISGLGRWEDDRLVRAFSASGDRIVEDEGIPQPFERTFWAGEHPPADVDPDNPLALPFDPAVLVRCAQRDWLGFELSRDGADLEVDGFANDGRREVRPARSGGPRSLWGRLGRTPGGAGDGGTPGDAYYDDYEPSGVADARADEPVREDSRIPGAAARARSVFGALQRRASAMVGRFGGPK